MTAKGDVALKAASEYEGHRSCRSTQVSVGVRNRGCVCRRSGDNIESRILLAGRSEMAKLQAHTYLGGLHCSVVGSSRGQQPLLG